MRKQLLVVVVVLLVVGVIMPTMAQAGEFRFPVGIAYVGGFKNVMDDLKEAYPVGSNFVLPVGLVFNPYYEFDFGLGIGASFGPLTYMTVDTGFGNTSSNFIIPIGADIRYTLFNKSNVSPYIRGGFRYDIAGGDYLESKSVGLFGGIGVEFMRTKRVSFGIEVSDDDSKIVVKGNGPYHDIPAKQDKEVAPCGFMASIYVIF